MIFDIGIGNLEDPMALSAMRVYYTLKNKPAGSYPKTIKKGSMMLLIGRFCVAGKDNAVCFESDSIVSLMDNALASFELSDLKQSGGLQTVHVIPTSSASDDSSRPTMNQPVESVEDIADDEDVIHDVKTRDDITEIQKMRNKRFNNIEKISRRDDVEEIEDPIRTSETNKIRDKAVSVLKSAERLVNENIEKNELSEPDPFELPSEEEPDIEQGYEDDKKPEVHPLHRYRQEYAWNTVGVSEPFIPLGRVDTQRHVVSPKRYILRLKVAKSRPAVL